MKAITLKILKASAIIGLLLIISLLYFYANTNYIESEQKNQTPVSNHTPGSAPEITPSLRINFPANGQIFSNYIINVNGTASDDTGLSKVEVKIGTENWQMAQGTASWSKSVSLASGSNTIYARATDKSGNFNETSVTVIYKASRKPEIGNFDYNYFDTSIRAIQDQPEITWDIIIKTSALAHNRPGVTTVYYDSVNPQTDFKMSDLNYVKERFDKATAEKDTGWDYGAFLLNEEVLTPVKRDEWTWMKAPLSSWNLDGTVTLAGIQIEALKPWYVGKYGAWNPAWWDVVKATNNYNDPIIKEWSNEYSLNLYKAWDVHMHNLGKKSAIIGPEAIDTTDYMDSFNHSYPGELGAYIINNYDFFLQYHYPDKVACSAWDCTDNSQNTVKALRASGYKGKLGWLLTAEWSESVGYPWREAVARDEFNKVAPYVDVIFARGYYNLIRGGADPKYYPPYLIKFWEEYQSP